MSTEMNAVAFGQFGGPEVLEVVQAAVPMPGQGQVSIDVAYAGVNFADLNARRAPSHYVSALPHIPGVEVSGRIRAIGPEVQGLAVGQAVSAIVGSGGYAQVALADAVSVFALSDGFDLRTAATVTTVLPTALGVVETGRLREGETVLIHTAAGGVGTAAGQLARAVGAGAVYGVVSSVAKAEHAAGHGYDRVFTRQDFGAQVREATHGRGVDLILDNVGADAITENLEILAPSGRVVFFGSVGGQLTQDDLFPGRSMSAFGVLANGPDALRALADRAFRKVLDGTVQMPATEFPLAQARAAHELMDSRRSTGKLVLEVGNLGHA